MEEKYFVIWNYDDPQIKVMGKKALKNFLEMFTRDELNKEGWERAKVVDSIKDLKIEDYDHDIIIIKGNLFVPEIKTKVEVNIDIEMSEGES